MNAAALSLLAVLTAAPAEAGSLLRMEQLQSAVEAPRVSPSDRSFETLAWQAGGGVAAAVVATPATILLASFVGTLSPNLVLAALPALITLVALPPLAVVLAEWLVGKWLHPSSARWTPAVWVGLGAQALIVTGAILLGADAQNFGHLALLTLVEAIVLPSAVTWSMRPSTPTTLSLLEERRPLPTRTAGMELPSAITVPVLRVAL